MTLVRFNGNPNAVFPYSNLLNEFLGDLSTTAGIESHRNVPAVNVAETAEAYQLEVAAPGFSKENFKVEVHENVLTIFGEKPEVQQEGVKYNRREFGSTSFKRSFRLPKLVNVEGIQASYDKGILYLSVPKREEVKPRSIQIS